MEDRKAKNAFRLPPLPIAAPDQGKKTVRSIFQHLHEILRASAVGQDKQAVAKVIPNHGIRAGLLVTWGHCTSYAETIHPER
jgi:hypothetical protein